MWTSLLLGRKCSLKWNCKCKLPRLNLHELHPTAVSTYSHIHPPYSIISSSAVHHIYVLNMEGKNLYFKLNIPQRST